MKEEKKILCSACGKILQEKGEKTVERDWLTVKKSWGYFSEKDGVRHEFCVCEECYDKWTAGFAVPVEARAETELLFA